MTNGAQMPNLPSSLTSHTLFHEDCIETTKRFEDASIDLIYADPPFFTGRLHSMNGCSFDDKWTSVDDYISWLKPRLQEFKRILKPTGTIYIHCDWHVSHYIKVLADSLFGMNNFINEIIWKRQSAHNDSKQGSKHFGRIHDTILVYASSQKYVWNQQFVPYDEGYVEKTYKYFEERSMRRYAVGDLTGPGGASKGNPQYEFLGIKRYWRYSEIRMNKLLSEGKIAHAAGKVPLLKRYLDEMRGKPVQDIWADINLDSSKKGRYPTQKPESLLERIIQTSSNVNQIVYEPFAGSSTAGHICHKLSRKWIGSDISKNACYFTLERLKKSSCEVKLFGKTEVTSKFDNDYNYGEIKNVC